MLHINKFSKFGLFLAFTYLIFAVYAFSVEFHCGGWGCGYVLAISILPWSLFLAKIVSSPIAGWIFWFFGIAVNLMIFYYIGLIIDKFIKKIKNRN